MARERFVAAAVECDGNRLHLDVIDVDRAAPTLVFVPGTAVHGMVYRDLLATLADGGVNVVSVDLRGHGRSGGKPGHYTIPALVRDARAAVDYARSHFAGPVVASGSSQGGIVALYLAATDAPLDGVICHNAADLSDPENLVHMGKSRMWLPVRRVVLAVASRFPEVEIDIQRYLDLLVPGRSKAKRMIAADPLALKVITLGALASLSSAPPARPLEQITTPVLLLHGRRDQVFPQRFADALFSRLRCPKEMKVYDRDHFIFTERVDTVVPDMLAWIRDRSPACA